MTDRPILFSGPMVRAILSGAKTVTRRVAVLREEGETDGNGYTTSGYEPDPAKGWGRCRPGDRLWVRETWNVGEWVSGDGYRVWFEPTPTIPKTRPPDVEIEYAADDPIPAMADDPPIFRPNIHMPRWACRLTLTVEDVRVERLHEIDDADAMREGVETRDHFADLWDGINGKRAPWDSNPWVWRVQFRRETP